MAEIQIISGPKSGELIYLGHGITSIGRDQTNSLQILDHEISRRHAELHIRENDFQVVDLNSANGTLVNGHAVSSKVLVDGDRIQLGKTVFAFFIESSKTECFHDGDANLHTDDNHGSAIGSTRSSQQLDQSNRRLLKMKSDLEMLYHATHRIGIH